MPHSAAETIYQAIESIELIDPHTHINPHAPASRTLADILGYHYYTELAHSAGMPKEPIEEPDLAPRELVRRLVENLQPLENTSQYHWLVAICQKFFSFQSDRLDSSNWEALYDTAEKTMSAADWSQTVLQESKVRAVFLTNDFDDSLEGFDTETYIPCLRTDDLVFKFHQRETQERLERSSGVSLNGSLSSLRDALRQRFEHFSAKGGRACAISLPPNFEPTLVNEGRGTNAFDAMLHQSESAAPAQKQAFSRTLFWMLAELCDEFGLPFDLMIGVNRGVYASGVYQGQDLYDSRVSLIQYRELFNAFADVKFPVSVLASVTNQELVSYAWIFPNVLTNGHWWYSNTPSFIHRDAQARLEAVPANKQIGYYSDAYKLEFVWPKFDMYRRVLSNVLADHFVGMNGWSEERAIELGHRVLRGNVEEIFLKQSASKMTFDSASSKPASSKPASTSDLGSIALAAEAIGTVAVEPIDQLPSEDEIQMLEVPDVELDRGSDQESHPDADAIDAQAEPDPLPLESLSFDNPSDESAASLHHEIQPLRNEKSFELDEDSLQLKPDPMTGELRLPNPAESNDEGENSEDDDFELRDE
ncbi:glucuronate isomerase [Novipirellula aureliae]|nr:glucuronate isomerase [Novipirellula aureliae]